jgi:hypothetical protein
MDGDLHRSSRSTEQRWLEECERVRIAPASRCRLVFFVVRCNFPCRYCQRERPGRRTAFSRAGVVVPYSPPPATALAPPHGTPAAVGASIPSTAAEGPRGVREGSLSASVTDLRRSMSRRDDVLACHPARPSRRGCHSLGSRSDRPQRGSLCRPRSVRGGRVSRNHASPGNRPPRLHAPRRSRRSRQPRHST